MERLSEFVEKLEDGKANYLEIEHYLKTKGIDRYLQVYELMKSKGLSLTWDNISTAYKYDKRLTYLLQRYLTFF